MLSAIEQRHAALEHAVANELASGAELVSQAGMNAVLAKGNEINFTLHLLLTVFTAGLWLIVWAILVATNHPQRVVLSVDQQGRVDRSVTPAS